MAKIGDLVRSLQVGSKKFTQPEWWSTAHKLKKQIKLEQLCKANSDLRFSYRGTSDSVDIQTAKIREMSGQLDSFKYKEFAPWNPVFRKYKQLILFKPNK